MMEYVSKIISEDGIDINFSLKNQILLESFEASLSEITKNEIIFNKPYSAGNWKFIINQNESDKFPVIFHL
ncbi:hypothetical protein [Fusobacterium simiae]|nr:hypothetical protein [Fusobacterium simiae]